MTGSLARAEITTAGVPQKIYTVPAGRAAAVSMLIVNRVGAAANLQVKATSMLSAPATTFSQATVLRSGTPYTIASTARAITSIFDIVGGRLLGAYQPSSPHVGFSLDLTDQLAPTAAANGLNLVTDQFSRDQSHWNAASANRFWAHLLGSTTLRRYIDSSSSPFQLGATTRDYTNCVNGLGYAAMAIGMDASNTMGGYYWTSAAPSTAGTADINTLTLVTGAFAGSGITDAEYRNPEFSRFFHANGVWFFVHINSSSQLLVWSTTTPGTGASWVQHTQTNQLPLAARSFAQGGGNPQATLVHHSGNYWLILRTSGGQTGVMRTSAPLAATPAWLALPSAPGNSAFASGGGFLRSNGRFFMAEAGYLDLTRNTVGSTAALRETTFDRPGTLLGPQNLHAFDKTTEPLSEAYSSYMAAVVTTGASDTTNDLTIYAGSSILRFTNTPGWSLARVGNNGEFLAPPSSLSNSATLAFTGRVLSAGDEVWVRSDVPGIGVRVDGFLQTV